MNEAAMTEAIDTADVDYMELDDIIEKEYGLDKENLIMILQAIQRRYNYLPQHALSYLATKIGVPMSQIYGVATFYNQFRFQPAGRFHIQVCRGTACHVKGTPPILAAMRALLPLLALAKRRR